jgi:uncharacterized membrane protein
MEFIIIIITILLLSSSFYPKIWKNDKFNYQSIIFGIYKIHSPTQILLPKYFQQPKNASSLHVRVILK